MTAQSPAWKDGFASFNSHVARLENPYGAHRLNWPPAREWDDGWRAALAVKAARSLP